MLRENPLSYSPEIRKEFARQSEEVIEEITLRTKIKCALLNADLATLRRVAAELETKKPAKKADSNGGES